MHSSKGNNTLIFQTICFLYNSVCLSKCLCTHMCVYTVPSCTSHPSTHGYASCFAN